MNMNDFDFKEWGYSFEKDENQLIITAVRQAKQKQKNLAAMGLITIVTMSSFAMISGPIVFLFLMMVGTLLLFKLIIVLFPPKDNRKLIRLTVNRSNETISVEKKGRTSARDNRLIPFSSYKKFAIEDSQVFTDANPFSNSSRVFFKKLLMLSDTGKIPLFSFSHSDKSTLVFVEVLKSELESFIGRR